MTKMRKTAPTRIRGSDFNKLLLTGEISPVYLFTGDQIRLMDEAIESLKKRVVGETVDFNLSLFYGDSASAKDIIGSAKTYPMLSKMRMVVVRNADRLPVAEFRLLEEYLLSPSPSTCLVLILTEERKLDVEGGEKITLVDFSLDKKGIHREIKEEARRLGYDITDEAIETLVSLVGENLQDIQTEIQKLTLFAGKRKRVEAEDVENLTERTQFKDVLQLINAISEKDRGKTLKALLELEARSEEPLYILNGIGRRVRLIWKAKELIDKNTPESEILKELRVSRGALYYIRKEASGLKYEDIRRISKILYEGDRDLKTSHIPKNLSLTRLVLELCK
jgi:DNA polymerase-3 subunit delta